MLSHCAVLRPLQIAWPFLSSQKGHTPNHLPLSGCHIIEDHNSPALINSGPGTRQSGADPMWLNPKDAWTGLSGAYQPCLACSFLQNPEPVHVYSLISWSVDPPVLPWGTLLCPCSLLLLLGVLESLLPKVMQLKCLIVGWGCRLA